MYIYINKNPDGSHAFQIGGNQEPGWAIIPDNISIPDSFPFVNIETAMVKHPSKTEITDYGEVVIIPEYTQLEVTSMTESQ